MWYISNIGGKQMKRRFKTFFMIMLSILTMAFLLGIFPACTRSPKTNLSDDSEEESGPKYVAHRGYSQYYVDNTEASFRAAAQKPFYGIETDIRKTKDGYFVCNHDAEVKYAGGSKKTISSTKRDALLSKPLVNTKTEEDAYLCTFETYLQVCKAGNKVAVIELKDSLYSQDDLYSILEIIDNEYTRKKVTFISFSYQPLSLLRTLAPTIPLQYLSQTENDEKFDRCIRENVSIDVKQTILTEELIERFHAAGLTVNVWTVNEEAELQMVLDLGVDYVTTNLFCGE